MIHCLCRQKRAFALINKDSNNINCAVPCNDCEEIRKKALRQIALHQRHKAHWLDDFFNNFTVLPAQAFKNLLILANR